jgi:predicted transcriptional regulator
MGLSLKDQRRAAGLTRQQLATEVGCSIAFLAMVEDGYRPAQSAVLPRIVACLEAHNDHERACDSPVGKVADRAAVSTV